MRLSGRHWRPRCAIFSYLQLVGLSLSRNGSQQVVFVEALCIERFKETRAVSTFECSTDKSSFEFLRFVLICSIPLWTSCLITEFSFVVRKP